MGIQIDQFRAVKKCFCIIQANRACCFFIISEDPFEKCYCYYIAAPKLIFKAMPN